MFQKLIKACKRPLPKCLFLPHSISLTITSLTLPSSLSSHGHSRSSIFVRPFVRIASPSLVSISVRCTASLFAICFGGITYNNTNLMDEKVKKKRSKIDISDLGNSFDLDPNQGEKKKQERKKKHASDKILNPNETLEENCTGEAADKQTSSIEGNITLLRNKDESHENKRDKKKGRKDVEATNSNIVNDREVQFLDENRESKMKKRKKGDYSSNEVQELGLSKPRKKGKMTEDHELKNNEGEDNDQGKQRKKNKKGEESQREEYNKFKGQHKGDDLDKKKKKEEKKKKKKEEKKRKKRMSEESKNKENSEIHSNEADQPLARIKSGIVTETDDQGKKMKIKKKTKAFSDETSKSSKPKRVTFSDQVDICCDGLVRGKRFSQEEDEKIKASVFNYIESHGLGDEGLDKILHCGSHPEVRDCWKEIAAALPERPTQGVYYRAHILFERDEKRKWTPEELDFLRKVQEQHGSDWKSVAEALGKHRFHVKDTWRRIKLTNTNKGRWTQEEYQNLFDLVNLDLRTRASEGQRKTKHGMLRDNIGWEAIGDKLATRTSARCCKKWYEQLTSPMVASGAWSDTDDYRLLDALFTLDACSMQEVDWDCLLEHRPGDVCRKRWNQMVQYIGEHGGKSFAEQVEILAKRFCPDLLEAREAFDEKPVVC
ncbi:hypothetical protein VNO77_13405 [Canavalia gladiata]|uniref:Uncharacterized protein n=1 Tax=Canavalia gladiata TaxID=3824 RepID=A0AAN9LXA3_CANGL